MGIMPCWQQDVLRLGCYNVSVQLLARFKPRSARGTSEYLVAINAEPGMPNQDKLILQCMTAAKSQVWLLEDVERALDNLPPASLYTA